MKELLDQLGWSQRKAAKVLGVTPVTISHWVAGEPGPTPTALAMLRLCVAIAQVSRTLCNAICQEIPKLDRRLPGGRPFTSADARIGRKARTPSLVDAPGKHSAHASEPKDWLTQGDEPSARKPVDDATPVDHVGF